MLKYSDDLTPAMMDPRIMNMFTIPSPVPDSPLPSPVVRDLRQQMILPGTTILPFADPIQQMYSQLALQQFLQIQNGVPFSLLTPTTPTTMLKSSELNIQQILAPKNDSLPLTPSELGEVLALNNSMEPNYAMPLIAVNSLELKPPITPEVHYGEAGLSCTTSPSTSRSKDEEEDFYVDVESVDNKVATKDRRKAHVEFFRKVKSIRQREKNLQCAICDEAVALNDNAIEQHVNFHADAGGYRCRICGFELTEKFKVYKHMRDRHPNKATLVEDRRNMIRLSAFIEEVFPRACARNKRETSKEIQRLVQNLEDKKILNVKCQVCEKVVATSQFAFMKHASSHPYYKCKSCKFITDNIEEQECHQFQSHAAAVPKVTVDYNVCSAIEVVSKGVQRCFSHASF